MGADCDSSLFFSKDGAQFWVRTVIGKTHVQGEAKTLRAALHKFVAAAKKGKK